MANRIDPQIERRPIGALRPYDRSKIVEIVVGPTAPSMMIVCPVRQLRLMHGSVSLPKSVIVEAMRLPCMQALLPGAFQTDHLVGFHIRCD